MESLHPEKDVDLDQIYDELDGMMEENWVKRLERDFGESKASHIFIQTENYNGFLYKDRAALHVLERDLESDPVYEVIEKYYGEEASDRV